MNTNTHTHLQAHTHTHTLVATVCVAVFVEQNVARKGKTFSLLLCLFARFLCCSSSSSRREEKNTFIFSLNTAHTAQPGERPATPTVHSVDIKKWLLFLHEAVLRLRAQQSATSESFNRNITYTPRAKLRCSSRSQGATGQTDVDVVGCSQCGGIQMVKAILHMSKGDKRRRNERRSRTNKRERKVAMKSANDAAPQGQKGWWWW